jgi:hypothetical protein
MQARLIKELGFFIILKIIHFNILSLVLFDFEY